MAEDGRSPKDFVDALVEDPKNPPQLQALSGYRGRSAEEGHTRLYLDPELARWVDIPDEAILLTRETQDEHGLGKSVVWAKLDAQIKQGAQGGGTGADFLQGQVAQDLGGGAGAAAHAQFPRTQLGCPTHAPQLCLHTPPRLCPRTPQCPTHPTVCCPPHTSSPEICPSLGIACTYLPPCPPPHTSNAQICPSIVDACPTRLCHTQDVARCLPNTSPQMCQVATPNPGCFPGGIGDPGGPVEGGQAAQAFRNVAFQGLTFQPCPPTPFCPPPNTHQWCTAPPTLVCPPHTHHPVWCQIGQPVTDFRAQGFQGQAAGVTQSPQCLQPIHPTVFCPVQTHQFFCPVVTHDFRHCVPQTPFCPVSPWCPTGPITGPTTTPQLGFGGFR